MSDKFFNELEIRKAFSIIKTINHPLRLSILEMIQQKEELTVTEIFTSLRKEQSLISQHLMLLKRADIVRSKKLGKLVIYSVNKPKIKNLMLSIQQINTQNGLR